MNFVNSEYYYRLYDYTFLPRAWENEGIAVIDIDLPEDIQYYYVSFKSAESLKQLKKVITQPILEQIINSDLYLLLDNSLESFHDVVEAIYQYAVLELRIPEEKIVLFTLSPDIVSHLKLVANNIGRKEFKCKLFNFAEWQIQTDKKFLLDSGNNIKTLENKHYDKKYIYFNRRWRLHRTALIAILHSIQLLDKGYVSFVQHTKDNSYWSATGWDIHWEQIVNIANDEILNLILPNKENIFNLPDMYLDNHNLEKVFGTKVGAALYSKTDYLFENSYFSLVSETNFYNYDPARHLSEKTYKPIAQKHPFIVISRPLSLELLRSKGYMTFSPFINESYDKEFDDNKRLLMIARETERLSNLNPDELSYFLNGVRNICNYNLNVLLSKTEFVFDLN